MKKKTSVSKAKKNSGTAKRKSPSAAVVSVGSDQDGRQTAVVCASQNAGTDVGDGQKRQRKPVHRIAGLLTSRKTLIRVSKEQKTPQPGLRSNENLLQEELSSVRQSLQGERQLREKAEHEAVQLKNNLVEQAAEVHRLISANELAQRQLDDFQTSLSEEKAAKEKIEGLLAESAVLIEGLQAEVRHLSAKQVKVEQQFCESQWYLGEEKAAKERLKGALADSAERIRRLAEENDCLRQELNERTRQYEESEWYRGEADSKVKDLEERISRQKNDSETLVRRISEMQSSMATCGQLAGEWMARWDNLIRETLKAGGRIDAEEIDNGRFFEKQLDSARQEIEALKEKQRDLLEELQEKEEALAELARQNRELHEEIAEVEDKNQVLEKKYSESEWYLGEARYTIQQLHGIKN
ncbi:MAG: hypothetical protein JW844_03640 [Candidatus Omnitrophica bacterium]|nr:hypothetical protein [Candidatus Omnitrophota bacterium]